MLVIYLTDQGYLVFCTLIFYADTTLISFVTGVTFSPVNISPSYTRKYKQLPLPDSPWVFQYMLNDVLCNPEGHIQMGVTGKWGVSECYAVTKRPDGGQG